jgi:hypothetical protein
MLTLPIGQSMHARKLVDDLLYDVSPTCGYSCRAQKSAISTIDSNAEDYDQIYESYSRIWSESARDQNTQLIFPSGYPARPDTASYSIHSQIDYKELMKQLRERASSLNKYINANREDKVNAWA